MKNEECTASEKLRIAESMVRLRDAGVIDWEEAGKDEDGFPIYRIKEIRRWPDDE